MTRTDRVARRDDTPVCYENGRPAHILASFDVLAEAPVPGAAYHDLCFYDLRAPSVYLRYEYPSGGAFSTSPRDVAYVLSDRWREVGPVHELVLKRHGLTLDAYQALVAEAWAALGGKLP